MKTILPFILILRCLPLFLATGVCFAAQSTETNSVKRPMAVFIDDSRVGKDPFFPQSTRRVRVASQPAPVAAPTKSAPAAVEAPLYLKGISGTKELPLAIINTTTLAEGELADVRTGIASVKIRCREIRDRSVLIEIAATGELRELKLREGI